MQPNCDHHDLQQQPHQHNSDSYDYNTNSGNMIFSSSELRVTTTTITHLKKYINSRPEMMQSGGLLRLALALQDWLASGGTNIPPGGFGWGSDRTPTCHQSTRCLYDHRVSPSPHGQSTDLHKCP